MNILHASSEVFPYSKTGGLADATAALAKSQAAAGHAVTLVTPLYRGIREKFDLGYHTKHVDTIFARVFGRDG